VTTEALRGRLAFELDTPRQQRDLGLVLNSSIVLEVERLVEYDGSEASRARGRRVRCMGKSTNCAYLILLLWQRTTLPSLAALAPRRRIGVGAVMKDCRSDQDLLTNFPIHSLLDEDDGVINISGA